jgi:hypothetical protein
MCRLINLNAGEFAVTDIEEIVWDSSSFEYLVLPKRQKYIIQSLAESQKMEVETPFNDLVKGKGQGLLILLQYDFYCVFLRIMLNYSIVVQLELERR